MAPAGTAITAQTAGDCKKVMCDGMGATMTADEDSDIPDDSSVCTVDTCVAGAVTHTPTNFGGACSVSGGGAGKCGASGACVPPAELVVSGTGSVLAFANAETATGNIAPARSLASTTSFQSAIDPGRDLLYVAGTTGGASTVGVFSPRTASGAAAPTRTMTLPGTAAYAVVADVAHDRIFTCDSTSTLRIIDSASTATGAVAEKATVTVGGNCFGLLYDNAHDRLYQAVYGTGVYVYDNIGNVAGNVTSASLAPRLISATTLTNGIGLAYDAGRDELYVANYTGAAGTTLPLVLAFGNASTANGVVTPLRTITGNAQLWNARGLYYDAELDELYVSTKGLNMVSAVSSAHTANGAFIGAATRMVAGANTTLLSPMFVLLQRP